MGNRCKMNHLKLFIPDPTAANYLLLSQFSNSMLEEVNLHAMYTGIGHTALLHDPIGRKFIQIVS